MALCALAQAAHAAPSSLASDGDWPSYGRDYAGTRFSPLTEVSAGNVDRLALAWSVPVARSATGDDAVPGAAGNPEATPIVVDGIMYLPVRGNEVLALEADSGKEIWRYALPAPLRTTARGVAYWPGDGDLPARILLTAGPTLVALDARSGRPAAGFGRDGIVQIAVPWNGVPLIYDNAAILGATTNEVALAEPGDTRAFDVRTGEHLWDFHTVPLPGEPGHETWLDHGWRNRSGATNDRRFRAFDSKTGEQLWAVELDHQVNADPMSYLGKDGRQYVAVVAGDVLVAFALR